MPAQTPDTPSTSRPPLRVAIADDHRLMLDGIRRALERAPDIRVVGEATSGEELLELVPRVLPDVVILDLRMPHGDGLTTLARLRAGYPQLKVIILSVLDDAESIARALAEGAAGYVVKSINPLDLPSAIRQVIEGSVHHPRAGAGGEGEAGGASRPGRSHAGGLSDRELAVLLLVAEGLANLAIADRLFVTEQTVKFHVSNIYRKLGVANRTEATRYAYRNRLIE